MLEERNYTGITHSMFLLKCLKEVFMLGVISSFAKTCIWITFLSKSSWICWLTAMGALAALKAVLGIGWTPMSELPK